MLDKNDPIWLIGNGMWNILTVVFFFVFSYLVIRDWSTIRARLATILSAIDSFLPPGNRRSDNKYPFFVGREVLRLFQVIAVWIAGLAPIGSLVTLFKNARDSIEEIVSGEQAGSNGIDPSAVAEMLIPQTLLVRMELGVLPLLVLFLGAMAFFMTQWHISRFNGWIAASNR